ncbi:MAG: hypothetical protein J7500_12750 [Sphingomonas sp.]|uniref:outer membrane lipoprotein n=1 Tax=Sphingomonas sp. TaxID=28214 RepID=UPI001B1FAD4C|nr:hypothetical protein [Sphingomonas sp.]MBO9623570.1 hypothetical protein [Sphingomonas sp.]
MKTTSTMLLCLAAATMVTGCMPTASTHSFPDEQAMRGQPVAFGTVAGVRRVEIRAGQTRLGALAGAVIGGAAGSTIGGNTAQNVIGATAGAVAGGAVGGTLAGAGRTQGVELTVELDSGEAVAVIQPGNPRDFRVGERVRVIGTAENARVVRR